ncbi:MAG: hypothetical protein JRJ68_00800 [Deltaproteobacteria bacterium]|nr:hypothetical protein [Deltaproteobacteria bacterium]
MSGFFGIYNRNGRVTGEEITSSMLEGISSWGPDDRGIWHQGSVALGHAMLWNTPESKFENLPASRDYMVITMDGRLDNREELALLLDIPGYLLDKLTDSDFIVRGYCKWEEECPEHFLGDFAFVIWDEKRQQLFCARDHVGVKQLYFHLTDTLFVCANDLKGLVAHPEIKKEISSEAVANFIVNAELISPELTFFKDIHKLPPAHSMTVTASRAVKKCYWRLEDAPQIQLSDADAYVEKLSELLERAVHDRIRSTYPVVSHLSGGLDSSTIAVIAARKLKENGGKLLAFNWLHKPTKNDDPSHYEWSNSREIAEAEGIDHRYVSLAAGDIYHYMGSHSIVYGDSSRFWYEYPVRQAAQDRGARTILSGWGGDELVTYHGQAYYADLFSRGKIKKVLKELKQKAFADKASPMRRFVGALYHNIFLIFVPRKIYRYMPRNRCAGELSFPFVKKEFLPVINKEAGKESTLTMQPKRTIRGHMLAYWENGHLQSRIESWAASALSNRLEYCYPLLDKRIVEFIVGVPAEYLVRNGVGRYLFRSAAGKLLPGSILWANAKEERARVERLVSLVLSAGKMFFSEGEGSRDEQSDYIDAGKLEETLAKLKITSMSYEELLLVQGVEVALSLISSMEIKRKELG